MLTVWKFHLPMANESIVWMPKDAKVLSMQVQHDEPCIWAIVDDNNPPVARKFRVWGTGHPMMPFAGEFLGTFQQRSFVWHVWEVKE